MNKVFLSLLLFVCSATTMFAAKSNGAVRYVQQPDGTTLAIQLLGNEDFSWYQTTDGVLLTEIDGAFYVAGTQNVYTFSSMMNPDYLPSTGILAHEASLRSAEETAAIDSQDRNIFFSSGETTLNSKQASTTDWLTSIEGYPSAKQFSPHHGTVRIPIILMNYSDQKFTCGSTAAIDSAKIYEIFNEYFNGTTKMPYTAETRFQGYGSAAQYFRDASGGDFNPVFDLYGPYTTANTHNYYGNSGGHSFTLLTEAVTKADPDIDFTQYDSNGDGKVDIVYVLHAGTGANSSGDRSDFWPACYYGLSISTKDNMTINVLGGANELSVKAASSPTGYNLRAGIGVFVHEMSHGLGMPDLYSTAVPKDTHGYADPNNCGPEMWDLMDGGENTYNGMWPCQYTAWEKDAMGWLDVEELTKDTTITIYPLNKEGGKAFRVTNPANPLEYYILENNQYDEWNYYTNYYYGNGLLLWHLNASSSTTDPGFSMSPNTTYQHPNITILPADNFILSSYAAGKTIWYKDNAVTMPSDNTFNTSYYNPEHKADTYPGTQNVTTLAAYKNYTLYNGDDLEQTYPITDITKNSDGSITFRFGLKSGDVNNDGVVDEKDALLVMDYYLGRIESLPYKKAADVNGDGAITIADANQIINMIGE